MDILAGNHQIKVNLVGKKLTNQVYLKCNLEKTTFFIRIVTKIRTIEMGLSPFFLGH